MARLLYKSKFAEAAQAGTVACPTFPSPVDFEFFNVYAIRSYQVDIAHEFKWGSMAQ